jgi:hypothetical protein
MKIFKISTTIASGSFILAAESAGLMIDEIVLMVVL